MPEVSKQTNKGKSVSRRSAGLGFPVQTLRQEMDQLFEKFFSPGRYSLFGSPFLSSYLRPDVEEYANMLTPDIDVTESEKEIVLTAELPGIDEKDIELEVVDGDLILRGEKKQEVKNQKGAEFAVHERRFGAFERRLRLPENVKVENIQADFEKGVLAIYLPKKLVKPKEQKRIKIHAKK